MAAFCFFIKFALLFFVYSFTNKLETVAKRLNLTVEEVITHLGGISAMTEKAKFTSIARPGLYYSDGTISDKVISDKQISGVDGFCLF